MNQCVFMYLARIYVHFECVNWTWTQGSLYRRTTTTKIVVNRAKGKRPRERENIIVCIYMFEHWRCMYLWLLTLFEWLLSSYILNRRLYVRYTEYIQLHLPFCVHCKYTVLCCQQKFYYITRLCMYCRLAMTTLVSLSLFVWVSVCLPFANAGSPTILVHSIHNMSNGETCIYSGTVPFSPFWSFVIALSRYGEWYRGNEKSAVW